jgi:signal transduction histidine kinase
MTGDHDQPSPSDLPAVDPQAVRLRELGTLAAELAHRLNNPLGAALLSAETALKISERGERGESLELSLRNVVRSLERCSGLLGAVLRFIQLEEPEKQPRRLDETVRAAVDQVRKNARVPAEAIQMNLNASEQALPLHQETMIAALQEILHNAVQSADSGVTVRVWTAVEGGQVRLTIADDGPGISAEELDRIFDPFFSTRRTEASLGLGMSFVYLTVRNHGGEIDVQSAPENGTRVEIVLPFEPYGERGT